MICNIKRSRVEGLEEIACHYHFWMLLICCQYDRGDVVSASGATVVGILGTIYGHYSEGDALPSVIPGILVLLPVKSNRASTLPVLMANIGLVSLLERC